MANSIQRPKRWMKKPKVDPSNPNKRGSDGYMNHPWMFNTKSRDRPSGHTRTSHPNDYNEDTKKRRFFSRSNKKLFENED